jgi:hypothetical protein
VNALMVRQDARERADGRAREIGGLSPHFAKRLNAGYGLNDHDLVMQ